MDFTHEKEVHQRRISHKRLVMRFLGKLEGHPYDVEIDVGNERATWLGTEVDKALDRSKTFENLKAMQEASPPPPSDEEDDGCEGCKDKSVFRALRQAAKGVTGLAQAKLGIRLVPQQEYERRRDICLHCPSGKYNGIGVCDPEKGGCGCYLDAKIRLRKECCPDEHWLPFEEA